MNIPDGLLPDYVQWIGVPVFLAVMLWALVYAPWHKLRGSANRHVFLAAVVAVMLLWEIRASVMPGLGFHLLGATAVCLMFGWAFGLLGLCLVLLGVTLNGGAGWLAYAQNALLMAVLPCLLTQAGLHIAQRWFPRHFFVYVFFNTFLVAALCIMATGLATAGLFWVSGVYSAALLREQYLPIWLLLAFPEAVLNGTVMTLLVVYRPAWVASFDDGMYLDGK